MRFFFLLYIQTIKKVSHFSNENCCVCVEVLLVEFDRKVVESPGVVFVKKERPKKKKKL